MTALTRTCPTLDQTAESLAMLRPRGRAWRHGAFDALAGSGLGRFLRWMAWGHREANIRACALLDEMFCTTAAETRDAWMLDHGLPDRCDPYADICAKVRAVGDTTIDYAVAALDRAGFIATIVESHILFRSKSTVGCHFRMGAARLSARDGVAWTVTIDPQSPALSGLRARSFRMGRARTGRRLGCGLLADAECILRRVMPAHADLVLIEP